MHKHGATKNTDGNGATKLSEKLEQKTPPQQPSTTKNN
jgi:hypothetical protein